MKKAFLEELAEDILRRYEADAGTLTIVFPNRRAGLFFRSYLSSKINAPLWAPEIFSIDDYILQFSSLQNADRITLVFELFEVFRSLSGSQEEFDRFYYWGELLLNDFDEIDKYLVNAELLFRDLAYQKEIELQYDYLSPEQKEAIISFWSSFQSRLSRHQDDFLKTWKILFETYRQFRLRLEEQGWAYPGMIYREIAENPQKAIRPDAGERIIFAGLNALTTAEETIVRKLLADGRAEMAWDFDRYYLDNPLHEAGSFLRKYQSDPVFSATFPKTIPALIEENKHRTIQVFGVGSNAGQVKKAASIIEKLATPGWDPQKTALILPDETLLFPALNSLPSNLEKVNITMGYPLKDTPAYNFAESLIELHLNSKQNKDETEFYHRFLANVARHSWFATFNPAESANILSLIEKNNRIYVSTQEISRNPEYPDIFRKPGDHTQMLEKIDETFTYIAAQNIPDLELEYVVHLKKHIIRLKELTAGRGPDISLKTLLRLFRQSVQNVKIPFSGEPLNGLQVMGALEARSLDFQNVFIMSFNEGSYPRAGAPHSFIPFNLRKGYGLPTFDYQDSIYSYNFFRLLQRSGNVYLFYNTAAENGGGEMSRFLYQLLYESRFNIQHSIVSCGISIEKEQPTIIRKTGVVLEKLKRYLSPASGFALTPSAINIFLDCRLRFYFRYVADLFEPDDVKEEVDPVLFGNLLHRLMEHIYQDFKGNGKPELTPIDIALLKNNLDKAVHEAFRSEFGASAGKFEIAGRNIIIAEIIKKIALRILENDEAYAPFRILGLEGGAGRKQFKGSVQIQSDSGERYQVAIKGIVDRIDRKEKTVRIIDYKTGKDNKKVQSIDSLLDRDNPARNKAAMQTLLYSLIYLQNYESAGLRIAPGIFNIRELFTDHFDYRLQLKRENGRDFEPVSDVTPYLPAFEDKLRDILKEIFEPSAVFDETTDRRKCAYCAYKNICNR